MAGNSRVIGRVKLITSSSSLLDTQAEFLVQYRCSGPVTGQIEGEAILVIDITQNDTQITSDLRTALAAYVNPIVFPAQAYAASDVRGLNL